MTTYRAMKTNEFKDAIYYRVACDCDDPEHDIQLVFEADEGIVTLTFYGTMQAWSWGYGCRPNFIKRLWWRFKAPLLFFFRGYTEVSRDMVILNEEHVESLVKVLKEGTDYLRGNDGDKEATI